MCRFFQAMNSDIAPLVTPARRVWLEPGRPTIIARRVIVTLYLDRLDGKYVTRVELKTRAAQREYLLHKRYMLDMTAETGLMMLMRALEWREDGQPLRVLVDLYNVLESLEAMT